MDDSISSILEKNHNVMRFNIISSTSIASRTAAAISHLTKNPPGSVKSDDMALPVEAQTDKQNPVVCLTARSQSANKLISIVEIAKRELTANNSSKKPACYQYSSLASEVVEIPRNPKAKITTDSTETLGDEDGDEDAFETMGPVDSGLKKRKVPVLTVYLSMAPIRQLAMLYGYVHWLVLQIRTDTSLG